jgi:hypothetical protein
VWGYELDALSSGQHPAVTGVFEYNNGTSCFIKRGEFSQELWSMEVVIRCSRGTWRQNGKYGHDDSGQKYSSKLARVF